MTDSVVARRRGNVVGVHDESYRGQQSDDERRLSVGHRTEWYDLVVLETTDAPLSLGRFHPVSLLTSTSTPLKLACRHLLHRSRSAEQGFF